MTEEVQPFISEADEFLLTEGNDRLILEFVIPVPLTEPVLQVSVQGVLIQRDSSVIPRTNVWGSNLPPTYEIRNLSEFPFITEAGDYLITQGNDRLVLEVDPL